MKKIISVCGLVSILCLFFSFTSNIKELKASDDLCFDFYVKCKGSNQFTETVKAKSLTVAKTMLINRYPSCTIQTKSTNGHKCE